MITPFTSQQPVDDFGLRFAGLLYSATLTATTDTPFTVPGAALTPGSLAPTKDKYKAVIKCSAEVWIAYNAVAAAPAGSTFASPTTSEMILPYQHTCREVNAGDVIHFFAPATADVSIILYAAYPSSATNN